VQLTDTETGLNSQYFTRTVLRQCHVSVLNDTDVITSHVINVKIGTQIENTTKSV